MHAEKFLVVTHAITSLILIKNLTLYYEEFILPIGLIYFGNYILGCLMISFPIACRNAHEDLSLDEHVSNSLEDNRYEAFEITLTFLTI